jgi:hypothetical protein
MNRASHLLTSILCYGGMLLLVGCKITPSAPSSAGPPVTSVGTTPAGAPLGVGIPPSIYVVVSDFATYKDWSPDSVIIFPTATTGYLGDEVPNWEIAGSRISLDGTGNLYVLTDKHIGVIPPYTPLLTESRTLPIGPGTKIPTVKDMAVSQKGELFISDGNGIAVFGETANGLTDPVRYISGNFQLGGGPSTAITPGRIAVDASGNVYVQNIADSSIVVFGPTATGAVVPSRMIAGPLAGLTSDGQIVGMTTDSTGNLYVLCNCVQASTNKTELGVFEFGPTASGNVSPIRFVTTAAMNSNNYSGTGIAVDSVGTIYVSGGTTIFEFSAAASGDVMPTNAVVVGYGSPTGIAVQ